jgi:hypothetical protein
MTQDDKKALQKELFELISQRNTLGMYRTYIEMGIYHNEQLNRKLIEEFSVAIVSRIAEHMAICEEEINKLTTLLEDAPEM